MADKPRRGIGSAARTALAIAAFLLAWELLVRVTGIKAYILPAPSEILADIWNRRLRYLNAADFTLRPMLLGFAMAGSGGIGEPGMAQMMAVCLLVFMAIAALVYLGGVFTCIGKLCSWRELVEAHKREVSVAPGNLRAGNYLIRKAMIDCNPKSVSILRLAAKEELVEPSHRCGL